MKPILTNFLIIYGIALLIGSAHAAEKNCKNIELDSFGKLDVNADLIVGGLKYAEMPTKKIDALDIIPPSNGIIQNTVYMDSIVVNWSNSSRTQPHCSLQLSSPWVGNFYRCSVSWSDRQLGASVLMHTKDSQVDPDKIALDVKDYITKDFFCF